MADKQINMPLLPFPSWANDTNMNDPGKPWDATPTKVEPGSGKRDDGFLPEENPDAQHVNQLLNEIGRWVQYLSTIQVMNWFDAGLIGTVASNTGECHVYDEGLGAWLFGGRADSFTSSRDGWTFAATFNSGQGFTWERCATKRPNDLPTHTGGNTLFTSHSIVAAVVVVAFEGGGFVSQTLPHVGTAIADQCDWDRINQRWIVAGREDMGGSPTNVFWYDGTPLAGFAKTTPVAAPNGTNEIIDLTHGEDGSGGALNVAVGAGVAPNFDVWTSTDGITWSPATPTGITAGEDARAIMWCQARQIFVLTTNDSVYTSTNGTAWSQVATYSGGPDFQFRALDNDGGGLWVAASDFSPTGIFYSYDGGVNWRFVAVPPAENGSTDPIHDVRYSRAQGRFGAMWIDNPPVTQGNFVLSLAVGETPYLKDNTIQPPTVT